jgi:hypothetical protein
MQAGLLAGVLSQLPGTRGLPPGGQLGRSPSPLLQLHAIAALAAAASKGSTCCSNLVTCVGDCWPPCAGWNAALVQCLRNGPQ